MKYSVRCPNCEEELKDKEVVYRDIININESYYAETCMISWDEVSSSVDEAIMNLEDFFDYLVKRYSCSRESIKTLFYDDIDIPSNVRGKLSYGHEDCGGYCPICDSVL